MADWSDEAKQVLEKRYLKKDRDGKIIETHDQMLDRVATAIATNEKQSNRWKIKFLEIMDSLEFLPNSPTLMNAGRSLGQLSACVSGETIIRTCAGDFTIKELVEKYPDKNEKFEVFSVESGKLQIGMAFNARKTREKAEVYKITFDDGSELKATKEHLILLRDGYYSKVEDLQIGQSIMPFNYFYNHNYLGVYARIDESPIMAHRLIYEKINNDCVKKSEVIHHRDYNSRNNSSSNLQKMDRQEHFKWHSEHLSEFNPMYRPEVAKKVSEKMMGNKSAVGFGRPPKRIKKQGFCKICGKEINKYFYENQEPSTCSKRCSILNWVNVGQENVINPFGGKHNTFGFLGKKHSDETKLKMSINNRWKKKEEIHNHKIISIEFSGYEDVYDLSVEKYHNFAANNIFVHNCFVLPIEDDLAAIFEAVKQSALIHKTGGGTGFSFSKLRPKNSMVNSTTGVASGPISFMYAFDAVTETVKQGGVRRGANLGLLNINHPDIVDFINCKKDLTKLQNFNISVGMNGKFMELAKNNKKHWLVNPINRDDRKQVEAKEIFELLCQNIWLHGEPGIVFLDNINSNNPIPWMGHIDSTNPCGEQPLLPWESCNLGSIDISKFWTKDGVDFDRLKKTVEVAVRFLDNVIDVNKYPRTKIATKTKMNRKIGLGIMGWADFLLKYGIRYDSDQAITLAETIMKFINETAHKYSEELGRDKGFFPSDNGRLKRRNATLTTIAPTGTLSMLAGCSSGIEPIFAKDFTKTVLGGVKLDMSKKYRGDKNKALVTALEVSPEYHIKMQAAFQRHVDNAVSKTINLPSNAPIDEISKGIYLAYDLGCKGLTFYRYGTREAPIEISTESLSECENGRCQI